MFNPNVKNSPTLQTGQSAGTEASSPQPAPVTQRGRSNSNAAALVAAGLPHSRASHGSSTARQNPPPTTSRAQANTRAPAFNEFVPGASGHLTVTGRKTLPPAGPVTPENGLIWGNLLRARLDQPPHHAERDDAIAMLDEIFKRPIKAGDTIFAAGDLAAPKGMLRAGPKLPPMLGFDRSSVSVQQIMAYPPRQGGGTALIQSVVNHAQKQGCNGVVRALSMSEADTKFYEKMGFEQERAWHVLVPGNKPNKWFKSASEEWTFLG